MMTTILFKNLTDEEFFSLIDESIPFILIPNFRPYQVRQWRNIPLYLNAHFKLETSMIRDMTVDLVADKKTVTSIFQQAEFNQMVLLLLTRKPPHTLKTTELKEEVADNILLANGMVTRIWINYEWTEVSSINPDYITRIKEKHASRLCEA